MSDYHLLICPSNGDGTIDWQSGTGTGGYTLAEHDPGIRTLTKRNPNYWKEGRAHFDEVRDAADCRSERAAQRPADELRRHASTTWTRRSSSG